MKAAKTPRRKRYDPAQSKPQFSELTALWFGDAPESEWKATKAKFGYYLHPQLVRLISVLNIPKAWHPLGVSKEWLRKYLDSYAIFQKHSGPELQEGLLAALLAGDDAFFEHLALTLRCLASGVELSNIQYVTVTNAYSSLMEKRVIKAWGKSDTQKASAKSKIAAPTGLRKAYILARAKARNYEGLSFPEPRQVLDEILKNPLYQQHRGYWEKGDPKVHLRTIRKHLRTANLRCSDARESKTAKPTKGRAKAQS